MGRPGLRGMVEAGRAAEEAGFESAWVAETRLTRDAVSAVTALLLATDRIRVGSAAINVFTRGAGLVAVTWATLAEAAPGRVVLGLGVGSQMPLRQQGYDVDHPVARLKETVEAVRAAWSSRGAVDVAGRYLRFRGLELEVKPTPAPRVYLCVGGPRALALAGAIADGVVLDAFLPPEFAVHARSLLDGGAPDGRFAGEVGGALIVSLADSRAEAAAPLKGLLATYLVNFPELAEVSGIDPELVGRIRSRWPDGVDAAAELVPTEVVARHALCGTARECRARLADYRDAGYELPILFPVGDTYETCIRLMAGA